MPLSNPDVASLGASDASQLAADLSATGRATAAAKVARQFQRPLSDAERQLASEILGIFVRDAEASVRVALSETLKAARDVPRDVALALARDVDSVSVPFLKVSEALTDDDLLSIIADCGEEAQTAIAERPTVSENISDALVGRGHETVVVALVGNPGAQISEGTLGTIVEVHGGSPAVAERLAVRPRMPLVLAEQLVHRIFDQLWETLASAQDIPEDILSDLILQARERALVALLPAGNGAFDLAALVAHLHAHRRLTPSIILRAVCMGDIGFLEAALAKLADVPVDNARRLIEDRGAGFERLLMACELPPKLLPVLRGAVHIAAETGYDGGPNDRARFRARVAERLLTSTEAGEELVDGRDLDYLIQKLAS
jgi:uncharacterized protein (DUF2336 family)